jgi:hypothetical protein
MRNSWGVSVFIGSVLFVSCTNGDTTVEQSGPSTVTGELKEWAVSVDTDSVPAGEVTFEITNNGTIQHEFLVVKTDIADGKIPVNGDHFSESLEGIDVIDEIGEFDMGTTESLTLTLEAGNYQLVCNIPAHYTAGMHTAFVVE